MDAHIGSYIFYEDLYRSDRIATYVVPFVNWYVTCPRFDRRYPNTSFNLVTGKSLYSYRNA